MDKKINIVLNGDEATINGENYIKKSSLNKPEEKKSNVPESWESLGEISGYFLNNGSGVEICDDYKTVIENGNIFTTIEEAEAVEAWAMLTQLRDATNGCPVEEVKEGYHLWRDSESGTIQVTRCYSYYKACTSLRFIRFTDADEFAEIHKDLILKASKLTL